MMKSLIHGLVVLPLLLLAHGCEITQQQPPNIVFFLADDLGRRDLGCFGSTYYDTPNIDALAKDGMLFTRKVEIQTDELLSRLELNPLLEARQVCIRSIVIRKLTGEVLTEWNF